MRRALVGIPEEDLRSLDALSRSQHVSRAELIRQAVSMYLAQSKPKEDADAAFGLWKDAGIDGLAYQNQMRDEW